MRNGLSKLKFDTFFEVDGSGRTRGNGLKLLKHRVVTDLRQHFFSERVVNQWNALDNEVVTASSLNVFKKELAKRRSLKMGLLMD